MGSHRPPEDPLQLPLSQYALDSCEYAVLDTVRHFLLAYTNLDQPHWETALELGNRHFGANNGPLTSVTVLEVIKALRKSRRTCFKFNNPYCRECCTKLSHCERHFCRTLHFARTGDRAKFQSEALILCEGFDTKAFLAEMESLANLLPCRTRFREMM